MTALERLAEASALLRSVEQSEDYSLPPRDDCERCGEIEELPCWWHYLLEKSDVIDRERIEKARRQQGVTR